MTLKYGKINYLIFQVYACTLYIHYYMSYVESIRNFSSYFKIIKLLRESFARWYILIKTQFVKIVECYVKIRIMWDLMFWKWECHFGCVTYVEKYLVFITQQKIISMVSE